jgi:uncharacterized membrane protein YjgN (DUF898 family)
MSEQESAPGPRAFEFDGNWREFAPIAFTNLLLTLVTLGVYAFWARARERRYLWSRTRFIDDRLEWVGTGMELFIGYVLAILIFAVPIWGLQFAFSILTARGQHEWAVLLLLILYLLGMYLVGVATFRALRYRLSRTFWHGIRGGSDVQGFQYGLSHLWRTIVGALAAGLLVPWAKVSLWNIRWQAMSFGPHPFESAARFERLMLRFLAYYLFPMVFFIGALILFAIVAPGAAENRREAMENFAIVAAIFFAVFFILLGLVALAYYSAFYREAIGNLSLGGLEFDFDARTADWFKLAVVNIALVVFTLGLGAVFLGYRNWAFFIRHLNAYGSVDLDDLTQSDTREPGHGEGLLDAFDVGAL